MDHRVTHFPLESVDRPRACGLWRTATVFAVASACACVLSACATSGGQRAAAPTAPRQVEIFYATNRAATDNERFFGRERGDTAFGIAEIGIPPNHVIGRREEPSVFRFEWSEDDRKHIALRAVRPLPPPSFMAGLNAAIEDSPDRKLLVFVHGYNMDFPAAARSLAQFATDLKFAGPALLFAWPSQASLTGYAVDANNVEWSQPHFIAVMEALLDDSAAEEIYVVAHSMGCRVVGRALTTITGERDSDGYRAIRQVILVAPDVDADLFRRDIAPRLARSALPVTLYASSGDRALMASKAFNGYPRAGDSGRGLVIVPGVETVDASEVSRGILGHAYFSEDRRIMEDIFALLSSGQRADNRFALQAVDSADGRYWTFRR